MIGIEKSYVENCTAQSKVKQHFAHKSAVEFIDFQKLDHFWNLWSKPNSGISPKKLYPAQFFHNFERKIGHEIFVKTEKTEYLSNQLTYAHFDRKFIFPIKFGTSEQIFIFLDFQNVSNFWNSYC